MMEYIIQTKNGHKMRNLNRRRAIREKCLNCSGWILKEVANCEFIDCDLYPFRSGKGKQEAKERAKSVRNYCLWCMNDQPGEVAKCPCHDCSLWPYRKTGVDKSLKIESLPEKGHIQPLFEHEIERASNGSRDNII